MISLKIDVSSSRLLFVVTVFWRKTKVEFSFDILLTYLSNLFHKIQYDKEEAACLASSMKKVKD